MSAARLLLRTGLRPRRAGSWLLVLSILVVVSGLLFNRDDRGADARTDAVAGVDAPAIDDATTATDDIAPVPGEVAAGDGSSADAAVDDGGSGTFVQPEGDAVPVEVRMSRTTDLRDGDVVAIDATATEGSQLFAVEARLCVADVQVTYDADTWPTARGWCANRPLSAVSDHHLQVPAERPGAPVHVDFRVGTGSTTFQRQDGTPATVECGPSHPCSLVLKFQIPNGFGFRTYPLTFAT